MYDLVTLHCYSGLYNVLDNQRFVSSIGNGKMQKTEMSVFVQNCKKTKMERFAFCVITFEPIRFKAC